MNYKTVVLINDKAIYNTRYRSVLIQYLLESGYIIDNIGVFDGPKSLYLALVSLLKKEKLILSSNLRANLFVLMFPWRRALIILNGLGRWRKYKVFRIFLLSLLRVNRKTILVQNFADYRYIRLYAKVNCAWMPGSGGSKREIGTTNEFLVVTRFDKFPDVIDSVLDFCVYNPNKNVYIVGCSDSEIKEICGLRSGALKLKGCGFVKQENLFKAGNKFIQPDGYGEGIPHSLVDALSSEMTCYIRRHAYVRFGLGVLGFSWSPFDNGWGEVINSLEARTKISSSSVNRQVVRYLELLEVDSF